MIVEILGCGSSLGMPIAGCDCALCVSKEDKDKRLRSSILIRNDDSVLLIDTSPDLRAQMLRSGVYSFRNILYTHAHADHSHGIDDLRIMRIRNQDVVAHSDERTLQDLQQKFGYLFFGCSSIGFIKTNKVKPLEEFTTDGFNITPYSQQHGAIPSLGFKIGNIAYSTDASELPEESLALLAGNIDLFIVGCIGYTSNIAHANLDQCLKWISIIKPEITVLTHLGHEIRYSELKQRIPESVLPAFDGMKIEIRGGRVYV